MSDLWAKRLSAATVAFGVTAFLAVVIALSGHVFYGDGTRVPLGVVVGFLFFSWYRDLRRGLDE